jgi:hypothetical protein
MMKFRPGGSVLFWYLHQNGSESRLKSSEVPGQVLYLFFWSFFVQHLYLPKCHLYSERVVTFPEGNDRNYLLESRRRLTIPFHRDLHQTVSSRLSFPISW